MHHAISLTNTDQELQCYRTPVDQNASPYILNAIYQNDKNEESMRNHIIAGPIISRYPHFGL